MSIPQTPSPLANILAAKTYNAAWFHGATKELQITAAIAAAAVDGASYVYVPMNMLPYTATAVTFNMAVTMICEGGSLSSIDVHAYGATGNGTAIDTTAINAAIAYSPAGSTISLRALTYFHDSDIIMTTGKKLVGTGRKSILKHDSGAMVKAAIQMIGTALVFLEHCAVRDLKIEGSSSRSGGFLSKDKGIFQEYCNYTYIERVWLTKIRGEAIYSQTDGAYFWWTDNLITDCAANAMNTNGALHSVIMRGNVAIGVGFMLFECSGSEFQLIDNSVFGFDSSAVSCLSGAHGVIRGNFISGGTNASNPAINAWNAENMILIDGNLLYDNAGRAINTGGGVGTTDRIVITNNILLNNAGPEQMFINSVKTFVHGNFVLKTSGSATYGIYIDTTGDKSTVIEGNLVRGHSTADIKRAAAANATFGKNTVTSRAFDGDRRDRVNITYRKTDYSANGLATTGYYKQPLDYDVISLTTVLDSTITAGTFEVRMIRDGSGNGTTKVTHTSGSNPDGGISGGAWVGHSAGSNISVEVANAAGVLPAATGVNVLVTLEYKVVEDNLLI